MIDIRRREKVYNDSNIIFKRANKDKRENDRPRI